MIKKWFVILFFGILVCVLAEKLPLPKLDSKTEAELADWWTQNAISPEEYVVSKFKKHDIVFLGEYHRIKHDAELVQNLIPLLYKAGVRHLGIEFACAAHQQDIDHLLEGKDYDRTLADSIFWRFWPFWGFQEYIDILKAAWQFNRSLPEGSQPFRVLGLNARMDWSHVWTPEDLQNQEIRAKAFPDGSSDEFMARIIQREILAKSHKALIYSGINHAYTRFQQPVIDEKTGELQSRVSTRMGNRIYKLIGDRCFLIFLHSPWPSLKGYEEEEVYPANGIIDAFFAKVPVEKQRVGFDIKGSPFGMLPDTMSLWSKSDKDFRIEMYCDGWIYQKCLSQYEGCTVVKGWINEGNRLEAISQSANPDPRVKHLDRTCEDMMNSIRSDTNFKQRFAHLQ